MNTIELLLDIIEDNMRRYRRVLAETSEACLHWQPDEQANSIAVTVWHVSRIVDIFVTQHFEAQPAESERWVTGGWAERHDYDPHGLGLLGWGAIIGYSPEEVAQIPRLRADLLLSYYEDVMLALMERVAALTPESLHENAPGFGGKHSRYYWLKTSFLDQTRHIGEIYALKAMFDRLPHPETVT